MGKLKAKWFRHEAGLVDSLAITEAIDENGIAAYAAYCIILERLTLEPEKAATLKSLLSLSRKYGIKRQVINNVVLNYNLFHYDKETDMVFCAELNESLEQQERISERYRDNGRKGGKPPKETKTEPNDNQTETKHEPNDNQNETKHEPNRIELNRIEENRIDTNTLVVQQSNDTLTILENPQDTKPPSKKILKSKSEPGFWIEGEKFESFQDEKLQQWLQPRINKFVLMQSWLTPEIIEDCFQKFFIKDEFYHNTWKGLYTHFSNYCQQRKKAEYINFKAPEKSKLWHAANSLIQEYRKNPTSHDELPFD